MKKSLVLISLLLIALIVLFMIQRQTQATLRQQNDSLRAQLEQLQNDNQQLSTSLARAQSASPPDDNSRELARLRNQVGMLRQQTNELGRMQIYQSGPAVNTAQNQAEPISPEDQFELDRIHTINALRQIELGAKIFAVDHNNQFPTNFDQMQKELGGATNFWGIHLDSVEFMNAGLLTDEMPSMINFRQKNPYQNPSGKWMRVYGFVDGSVQTKYSEDGNFDDYEKEHSPPPAQ